MANTDCASWSMTFTVGSRPGIKIAKSTETPVVKGTTAAELNTAMSDEADVDWSWRTNTKYVYPPVRVTSFTLTVDVSYQVPKWTAPAGTAPELVAAWNKAVSGMRRHLEGYAAIGVQMAGRYLAAATKKSFSSAGAISAYHNKLSDKYLDLAGDQAKAYTENTQYGMLQGAFIP